MKVPVELQAGESVLMRCRRHPVFVVARLLAIALAGVVPVVALLWLANRTLGLGGTGGLIMIAVAVVWLLFWIFRAWLTWYRYQHDEWIITNQRLLDVYRSNPFNQQLASTDLINVQDMSVRKNGLLATVFNFGDLECDTAGSTEKFVLSAIPRPAEVLSLMDARRDAARIELQTLPRAATQPAPYATLPDAIPPRRPPNLRG